MKALFIIPVLFLMAGCATKQELAARDDAACRGYGFRQGTEGYAACRLAIDDRRTAERGAWSRTVLWSY